jgi:hypothetical protein
LTIFAVFAAEAAIGTIWSSSPCMTSVGTSIFLRFSRVVDFRELPNAVVLTFDAALHAH